MDFFFNTLKKGLVAMMMVVFAFVATYTPQSPVNQVEEAHAAAALGNFASELTQMANNLLLSLGITIDTANMGANMSNWFKENVLDGLGWAITQRIIVRMIRSTLDWIASGFQGRPGFLQDFRGFLFNVLDAEIGRVIEDLGGIGSFICSPFRLDVSIAVEAQYARYRSKQTAPSCTLTGVVDNIRGFVQGTDPGNGLRDWINITASPDSATPYGAVLSAQAHARARLINAEGEQIKLLDFGDGYRSLRVCRDTGGVRNREQCTITMPGQTIANQVNETLRLPADLAIAADEIDEAIVSGLMNLLDRALNGSGGLLGLSGGDGFGGYAAGPTYLDDLGDEADAAIGAQGGLGLITVALSDEADFQTEAQRIRTIFVTFLGGASVPSTIAQASAVIAEIDIALLSASNNITALNDMSNRYVTATEDERGNIMVEFTNLNLTDAAQASQHYSDWRTVAQNLGLDLDVARPIGAPPIGAPLGG